MKSRGSNRGHDLKRRDGGGGKERRRGLGKEEEKERRSGEGKERKDKGKQSGREDDSLQGGQRGGRETCDSVGQLSVKRGHSYRFQGWVWPIAGQRGGDPDLTRFVIFTVGLILG